MKNHIYVRKEKGAVFWTDENGELWTAPLTVDGRIAFEDRGLVEFFNIDTDDAKWCRKLERHINQMKQPKGRRKGQSAFCIRCGRAFVRAYADHIVCYPGCKGDEIDGLEEIDSDLSIPSDDSDEEAGGS